MGGHQIMIRLMVAAAALLAASQARAEPTAAPVYTWTAYPTLISGSTRNCQDGFNGRYPPYKLELRGNRLTGAPVQGENANVSTIELELSSLNSAGPGKIIIIH